MVEKSKIFDGKEYKALRTYGNKAGALTYAQQMRRAGGRLIRVHTSTKNKKKRYTIYMRLKKSR